MNDKGNDGEPRLAAHGDEISVLRVVIPAPTTASSIRRSITPRPCSIPMPRISSPIARATNTAAAARRPPRRSNWRCRSSRGRNAPACHCCRRGSRRFRRRCYRSCVPATMCWSPTAPMGRRGIFANKFCRGSASPPPITIPASAAGIAELLQPNTRAVYLESPGSLSFEMQDIAAIAKAAHAKGALVLMDNTWATPLYFRPLDHGVDLVDPGRHEIYRRPFRRHARHRLGQCGDGGGTEKHRAPDRPVRRPGRRLSRPARLAHARHAA